MLLLVDDLHVRRHDRAQVGQQPGPGRRRHPRSTSTSEATEAAPATATAAASPSLRLLMSHHLLPSPRNVSAEPIPVSPGGRKRRGDLLRDLERERLVPAVGQDGAAYALKYQDKPGVVICQVGDATTNIGPWYESLNLAKLYQLPAIFFIVNNGFGMGTAVNEGFLRAGSYKKGLSFRIHGEQVDGSDVLAVRDVSRRLREKAEKDKEPAIMDVVSFRFRGHSVIDPDRYRNQDEVKKGRASTIRSPSSRASCSKARSPTTSG